MVVIGFAVLAGLAVVLFTWLYDAAFDLFQGVQTSVWWASLVWTPAITALVVWALRSWPPGRGGRACRR
jgi:H+/Cl- antiporter ClcA